MSSENIIMQSYIENQYKKELVPVLRKQFNIDNAMAVPELVKIVINCGLGEALADKKILEKMEVQLLVICGQKPVITKAKKAISSFFLVCRLYILISGTSTAFCPEKTAEIFPLRPLSFPAITII